MLFIKQIRESDADATHYLLEVLNALRTVNRAIPILLIVEFELSHIWLSALRV